VEAKKRKGQPGLAAFYREYLQKASDDRSATMAATQAVPEPATNLRIVRPLKIAPDPDSVFKASESEAEKMQRAREEGKEVELNDDGMLVDKRDLLLAGLNLAAPNTRKVGLGSQAFRKTEPEDAVHRAAGSAASRHEIRARQAKELQKQYAEEQERIAAQKTREEEEEKQRQIKRKNDEQDVQNARERYLQRKKQRLEGADANTT